MRKKLALITPLYNTDERFLDALIKCIDPYKENIEWVLVNDSPHNRELQKLLKKLDPEYTKIFVHEYNKGIFEAYTTGFLNASAEYCCILDHDDVFDAGHVLQSIEDKPDLIYTNEYKFNGKRKFDEFNKPDFDILSTCFYFYTHHVTVMKTEIVKEILREKGNSGGYTSLFDIHISLEYMSKFIGKKFNVIHLNYADYGWRIHDKSTAGNLEQKLSGYFERLHKVEEFFNERGEHPMLNIHKDIGYVVEGDFLSLYDILRYPLKVDEFIDYFSNSGELSAGGGRVYFDRKKHSQETWRYFYRMLFKIPVKYLKQQGCTHFFVPEPEKREGISPDNYKFHPPGVPFMVEFTRHALKNLHYRGMWIDLGTEVEDDIVFCIIIK